MHSFGNCGLPEHFNIYFSKNAPARNYQTKIASS